MKKNSLSIVLLCMLFGSLSAQETNSSLIIKEQGSYFVGGSLTTNKNGSVFHGDHGYVYYQMPIHPHKLPIVLLHGIYQSSKTWESTPDGREGFQNIFLKKGFSVYNMTQPRRGNAGRTVECKNTEPVYDEQDWYTKWRIGIYPNYFENVQFPRDKESMNQFLRQITPDTGPLDFEINANAIAALFDKLEGAILIAHSQGVMHAWKTIPKTKNIKALIGLEGGGFFSFPTDEPSPQTDAEEGIEHIRVQPDTFETFTKIPILLIYGDNIPTEHSSIPELDIWRIRLKLAKQWAATVNRRGGDVTIIHLPEKGIYGNTHFLMSDLNNKKIAEIIYQWLKTKKLL